MIHEKYFDQRNDNNSLVKKTSKKYITTHNNELTDIVATVNKIEPKRIEMGNNLTIDEQTALKE